MRYLGDISEHSMVAVFLQGEIQSERFGTDILRLLQRDGMPRTIIDHPDTKNDAENSYRLRLLGDFRGYKRNHGLFQDFPQQVTWQCVAFARDELFRVKYIDYDYWVELSGGSRYAQDAARTIRAEQTVFNVPPDGFLRIADALHCGATFPELIMVRAGEGADVVVLEGHVRLTVYALVPEAVPSELPVILGTSPEMTRWGLY